MRSKIVVTVANECAMGDLVRKKAASLHFLRFEDYSAVCRRF